MGIRVGTYVARQSSDSENKVELCDGLFVNDGIGAANVLFVQGKECWTMKDREEWSPFLEKDVDHLVRDQAWWCFE
jgi:hypothetical protein